MTQNVFPVTGGPDLVCIDDVDPLATETTSEVQSLSQDCYHSLLAWPRSNPDVPDRGVGVEQYLSGTAEDAARLPSAIEADFHKDPRIVGCAATLTVQADGSYLIEVQVESVVGVFGLSYGYTQGQGLVPLAP